MEEKKAKRKLAAILSADVKGYSHLMQDDEEATVHTITAYREVMTNLIQEYDGRVVDAKGDNILAEFPSVVDAVRCGVEIQKELKVRNAELPEERKMEFRIGINLGDVIEEGDTIYGDGVNIAARLEGLAAGGGICVSGTTYDQIGKKLDLGYEYLGEQAVKNIEKPVRVYRVLMEPEEAGRVIGEERPKPKNWRWAVIATVAVLIIVAGAWAIWNFYFRPPPIEPASVEKMAFSLPDLPSIAVLPFTNMSDDPKQEFLSDGITENIITALSKVPRLFVIARNSTFTYKGKPVKIKQVSEELGVQYVLEGSVQRSADRIRITAQLIDALKGYHLWAERYDRDLTEIFALQDEITLKILKAIQVKLTEGETYWSVPYAGGKQDLDCHLKAMEALGHVQRVNIEDINVARRIAEEAIATCPEPLKPYNLMAAIHMMDYWFGTGKSPRESIRKAIELAQKSLTVDDARAESHALLGQLYSLRKEWDKAIAEGERGVALNPSGADVKYWYAATLTFAGKPEEAILLFEKAIRLNPFGPSRYFLSYGHALRYVGRFEEAVSAYKKALQREPNNFFAHLNLAATYNMMGLEKEAQAEASEVLRLNPKFSLDYLAKVSGYKDRTETEKIITALRKAGLPDKPPLPLPDKPSIAVLPFTNISGDPEQEYFADGMTDDLITDLSKIAGLFVIARNSVFTYKGKSVKVKQIGRDLGVRYVLEGSVRKADNQVRINAQLIDTTTGGHLWAERYDGEMANIFDLQDKINQKITSALAVKLTVGEKALVGQKGTNDPAAYEELLKGRGHYLRNTTEDFTKAEACFKRAIQLDPNYGQARASLAMLYWFAAQQRKEAAFKISYLEARLRARQYLREAMKEPTSIAYQVGGVMDLNLRQHDEAISQLEKALTLDPNDPACLAAMSRVLSFSGRPAEGLEYAKDAMRLDPLNPGRYLAYMGIAHFCMGEWQDTVTVIEKALKLNPELRAFAGYLASAYAHLGRDDESKAAAQTFRRGSPGRRSFDALPPARRWMSFYPFKDRGVADSFLESLKRVGLLAPGPGYIHVSKKDQLTGAELRAFYCRSTITGLSVRDGSVWSVETTKGGTSTYRANFVPGGVDTGKMWFEGDKVWVQYSKFLFGMAFCLTTFKNPRGTHEGKDEYVQVSDLTMSPFSRVR